MPISKKYRIAKSMLIGGVVGALCYGMVGLIIAINTNMNTAEEFKAGLIAVAASFGLGLIAGLIASVTVSMFRCRIWLSYFVGAFVVGAAWVAALYIVETSKVIPPGSGVVPPAILMIAIFTCPLVPIGGFAGLAASGFLELTKPPKVSPEDQPPPPGF